MKKGDCQCRQDTTFVKFSSSGIQSIIFFCICGHSNLSMFYTFNTTLDAVIFSSTTDNDSKHFNQSKNKSNAPYIIIHNMSNVYNNNNKQK
eukprot:4764813-Ditylum_brightwellii.AAC.1